MTGADAWVGWGGGGVGGCDLGRHLGGGEVTWPAAWPGWGWGLFYIEMRTDVKSQPLSLGLWPGSVFYWCLCKLQRWQAFVVACPGMLWLASARVSF